MNQGINVNAELVKEKIRRARLSGPPSVTSEATVAEMDAQGKMVVLHQGTNQWVCMSGNENIIGDVPMSLDPMGMQWISHSRSPFPGLMARPNSKKNDASVTGAPLKTSPRRDSLHLARGIISV